MAASPSSSRRPALVTALIETFGFSPALASAVVLFLGALLLAAVVWVVRSAPPRTLVMIGGPEGSTFHRWALAYQRSLAKHGVELEIRPSAGSLDNLDRLQSGRPRIDVGFVAGGLPDDANFSRLHSLGSVAYQPLLVFTRGTAPVARLSDLAGRRLAIGAPGSATRLLSTRLLQANGITGTPTTFVDLDADAAAAALLEGRLDAVFLMGDSASLQTIRTLALTDGIQWFSFRQADAYVRRFAYLNPIRLPEGAVDLGRNLPSTDILLVGPTVELVARRDLNPALSDLVLEAAQEVHGKAGLLQKRGEFPAPLEHEFPLSDDAVRYYKSGKGWMYKAIGSFWIANLVNRVLVVVVPLLLILIPVLRLLPVVYQLSVKLRIYRCYRPLLRIERDAAGTLTPERARELLGRLAEVDAIVERLRVPASFADQFYELRVHLAFVRQRLEAAAAGTPAPR